MHQRTLSIDNNGRGMTDITGRIASVVSEAGVDTGLAHVFIQHTSASLIVCENADPSVQRDLERFTERWVPDGDLLFEHDTEGPDDMAAHVRSVFTNTSLTLPVTGSRLNLGTWQGILLWEHRYQACQRRVVVTVQG